MTTRRALRFGATVNTTRLLSIGRSLPRADAPMLAWRSVQAAVAMIAWLGFSSSAAQGTFGRQGDEIQIRAVPGIQNDGAALLPGGGFVSVWTEPRGVDPGNAQARASILLRSERNVLAAWFSAGGVPIGAPVVVNSSSMGLSYWADVAVNSDGEVLIVWPSWADRTVMGRLFDSTGSPTSDPIRLNENLTRFTSEIAATATDTGQFVVVWNDLDDTLPYDRVLLQGLTISPEGVLGTAFVVDPAESYNEQVTPDLESGPDGEVLVTWYNEATITVHGKLLTPDHPTSSFQVGPGGGYNLRPESCFWPDGEFVVAWQGSMTEADEPVVGYRLYDKDGEALSDRQIALPDEEEGRQEAERRHLRDESEPLRSQLDHTRRNHGALHPEKPRTTASSVLKSLGAKLVRHSWWEMIESWLSPGRSALTPTRTWARPTASCARRSSLPRQRCLPGRLQSRPQGLD